MDDTCAVCAESLEWVAYGSCGHKEVCSTCVARLRFICSDRRCCICKTESSLIFVTKALGDYTKMINDFSVFPPEGKEGRSGAYWYHEDTQSYFDDFDQYKMIKAMCRLSCSVCDKVEENTTNSSKRKARFRDIHQLKGHLFHQHKLFMCSLCLEGRKVFICEQKLYSKSQLKQHINTGDSEVDGTESERGGFQGHPLCEFCRSPFYGDNELYTHMSTEHYTCHICQRQNPGQYEYYKNYDDLEIHFRQQHFLCEDEACLSKKFIVFTSEAEMKRHNALEHGGRMSRSKRNAALQLPTSFTYRRQSEQNNRHGRRNPFQRDLSESELSRAIEASLETANTNTRYPESSSSSSDLINTNGFEPLITSMESLTTESDPRYLMAVSHRPRNSQLQDTSSFPPLSTAPTSSSTTTTTTTQTPPRNTMAEKLKKSQNKKKVNVINPGQAWPTASRFTTPSPSPSPPFPFPVLRPPNPTPLASIVKPTAKSTGKSTVNQLSQPNPILSSSSSSTSSSSSSSSSSSLNWKTTTSKMSHSSSAPNLVDSASVSDFPPVSSTIANFPTIWSTTANGNATRNVYAANKSMVEKIREGLNHDEDRYTSFKEVSGEYRRGTIDAETYLVYVEQFGLSHLVLDLATLCPDPRKEKELIAVYNANKNHTSNSSISNSKGNGKGKGVVGNGSSSGDRILDSVRDLQSNYRPPEEEVETLSKDGYRVSKGKMKVEVNGVDEGRSKVKKKTSKFHRVRLGDGSMAAILDLTGSNKDAEMEEEALNGNKDASDGVPVRGVWRNGGGHRLIQKRG